ncbi:MAG: hypothetical protein AB7S26_39120 [Sandaracinaceae bacterium]
MHETLLHHKPVSYGSDLADYAFIAVVAAHAVLGGLGFATSFVALFAKKGRRLHVASGLWFVRAMVGAALSGIVIDVIRLGVRYAPNHTQVDGLAMPSSIPARIAFLYAALAVLYLAAVGGRRATFEKDGAASAWVRVSMTPALAAAGVASIALIALRFDPWTGAIWMIATFVALVLMVGQLERTRAERRAPGLAVHRLSMLGLASFSWWGAAQGFGPALAYALRGVEAAAGPYVGDQPGPFRLQFLGYLAFWAPAFVIAALLYRRYARVSAPREARA